jgi:hypothetical protein
MDNPGTTAVSTTITVTPYIDNCSGGSKKFTITVNPVPTVNEIENVTLLGGDSAGEISFSTTIVSPEVTYSWSADSNWGAVGLPAGNGTGKIAPFTVPKNVGSAALSTKVTVTPEIGNCSGDSKDFTITVDPVPTLSRTLGRTPDVTPVPTKEAVGSGRTPGGQIVPEAPAISAIPSHAEDGRTICGTGCSGTLAIASPGLMADAGTVSVTVGGTIGGLLLAVVIAGIVIIIVFLRRRERDAVGHGEEDYFDPKVDMIDGTAPLGSSNRYVSQEGFSGDGERPNIPEVDCVIHEG